MKTVTIEGHEYDVPDHANYIAMDSDGDWWWFERKPKWMNMGFWMEGGESGEIRAGVSPQTTLQKID